MCERPGGEEERKICYGLFGWGSWVTVSIHSMHVYRSQDKVFDSLLFP